MGLFWWKFLNHKYLAGAVLIKDASFFTAAITTKLDGVNWAERSSLSTFMQCFILSDWVKT